MRSLHVYFLTFALAGTLLSGCDSFGGDEKNDTGGVVTLTGRVLNGQDPVSGAEVLTTQYPDQTTLTDADGLYSLSVVIDSTMQVNIFARRNGVVSSTQSLLAVKDEVIAVEPLRIQQEEEEVEESGLASNILLLSQSAAAIGVAESGSNEVATIIFQVADSLGRPITLGRAVDVRFSLGEQPGGGEFIYPNVARTNNSGQVEVNLSSGSRAGVVQIVSEATVGSKVIRSLPVAISIHGGHPDQTHFSIGPAKFNFPGLRRYGLTNTISVIVGDVYGNPVRPGTSVYFTTNFAVIEGSTITGGTGQGAANLISANPLPPDGVAIVTATTADENQVSVFGQTPVLLTGAPVISLFPAIIEIGQLYSLTVTDYNGNPLAEGTSISVTAGGKKVKVVGNTLVRLDDTVFAGGMTYDHVLRGPGITQFNFAIVEEVDDTGEPSVLETLAIKVAGPNGELEIVWGSFGEPSVRTEGATIEVRNNVATIRAAEQ